MFKVNNKDMVFLLLTLNIFHTCGVSIVNFEQANAGWAECFRKVIFRSCMNTQSRQVSAF